MVATQNPLMQLDAHLRVALTRDPELLHAVQAVVAGFDPAALAHTIRWAALVVAFDTERTNDDDDDNR